MAPFLACSVYAAGPNQPTEFEVYMDGATSPVISAAFPDSGGVRLNYDLATIGTGNHTVIVKAAKPSTQWGRLTSPASSPFAFERPSAPSAPTGLVIIT